MTTEPQRCCYLGDDGVSPCPHDATLTIVDGDPLAPTYVCEQHRGAYAGEAFPLGSG